MPTLDDLRRVQLLRELEPKQAFASVVTSGTTTIITPGPNRSIQVYWVYALTDPDSETSPLITVSIGSVDVYKGYAISHSETLQGLPGESVTVTLSEPATVAVTIHYKEI